MPPTPEGAERKKTGVLLDVVFVFLFVRNGGHTVTKISEEQQKV